MHKVKTKGILSSYNGMNLCRGCLHGCIYCDSRSKCYHIEHDFEDIALKENAPLLLEDALKKKRNKCMISTGSMSDPYLPDAQSLALTRRCLEIIDKYGFGASLITKSDLVLNDLDLFISINSHSKCVIQMTLTTFDDSLCRIIEPNVCVTSRRAEVLNILRDNGIPTVVWLSPILPYINDTEENISGILDYCIKAKVRGIINFGFGLTLREGNREYFYSKLDEHFPGLKEKYIYTYGNSYELPVPNSRKLNEMFVSVCEKNGIMHDFDEIFEYIRLYEDKSVPEQLSLF